MGKNYLVQRFVVEQAEAASPILPQHVALTREDGSPVLGDLAKLDASASTAKIVEAFNSLVDTLVSCGLAISAAAAAVDLDTLAAIAEDAQDDGEPAAIAEDAPDDGEPAAETEDAPDDGEPEEAMPDPQSAPTMANTRDEIAAYAAEKGIDLTGVKTKAAMLDAIAAA